MLPLPVVTCHANMAVCVDDLAFALANAIPAGGVCSGAFGIPVANFNPAAWEVGLDIIFYNYTDPNTGCSNWCSFTINVLPLPVVICPENMSVCIDVLPFDLAGGPPLGGIYAGAGDGAGVFNSVAAGVGVHIITYTYTDPAT